MTLARAHCCSSTCHSPAQEAGAGEQGIHVDCCRSKAAKLQAFCEVSRSQRKRQALQGRGRGSTPLVFVACKLGALVPVLQSCGEIIEMNFIDIYKDEKLIATIPEVNRAIPNPDGRYIAIEVDGQVIKPEDRPLPKDLTEEQRKRERIRLKQRYEKLPNWAKNNKPPPEIHVIDLKSKERIRFLDFYGKKFEWYAPHPLLHATMILQGISQKKINQNIGFIRIEEFLIEVELGRPPDNVEVVGKIK